MSEATKPECIKDNWHDTRHRMIITVVPRVINVWPLDPNSVSVALHCKNGCGLEFAACVVPTVNGLSFPRIDINKQHGT